MNIREILEKKKPILDELDRMRFQAVNSFNEDIVLLKYAVGST